MVFNKIVMVSIKCKILYNECLNNNIITINSHKPNLIHLFVFNVILLTVKKSLTRFSLKIIIY